MIKQDGIFYNEIHCIYYEILSFFFYLLYDEIYG